MLVVNLAVAATRYPGGLHGVGISVVNALSEWTKVQVAQNGIVQEISFARGHKTSELHEIGKAEGNWYYCYLQAGC